MMCSGGRSSNARPCDRVPSPERSANPPNPSTEDGRTFRSSENIFVQATFVFVQNGKFSSEIYKSTEGFRPAAAKCIFTSRGEKGAAAEQATSLPGDKGPIPSNPEKKGRDASGASSGAEALIASSDIAQPMSASAIRIKGNLVKMSVTRYRLHLHRLRHAKVSIYVQ